MYLSLIFTGIRNSHFLETSRGFLPPDLGYRIQQPNNPQLDCDLTRSIHTFVTVLGDLMTRCWSVSNSIRRAILANRACLVNIGFLPSQNYRILSDLNDMTFISWITIVRSGTVPPTKLYTSGAVSRNIKNLRNFLFLKPDSKLAYIQVPFRIPHSVTSRSVSYACQGLYCFVLEHLLQPALLKMCFRFRKNSSQFEKECWSKDVSRQTKLGLKS